MAFDAFIKIDGIEGESTDDKHQGWIELIRYGMGVKQTVSTTASSAGGDSAERADFSDFLIRKFIDKSSPELAIACADGTHIDQIVVELCRAGTDKVTFLLNQLRIFVNVTLVTSFFTVLYYRDNAHLIFKIGSYGKGRSHADEYFIALLPSRISGSESAE